jgi:hypothetical protein
VEFFGKPCIRKELGVIQFGVNKTKQTMKLEELVRYFRTRGTFEKFTQTMSLNRESEIIEIYMKKPFNLNKDLAFFEIEKTDGRIEYLSDGEL